MTSLRPDGAEQVHQDPLRVLLRSPRRLLALIVLLTVAGFGLYALGEAVFPRSWK